MKPINLPKESQEALLNGASMFLVPIPKEYQNNKFMKEFWTKGALIAGNPYQKGDEVYLQEEQSLEDDMVFNPYSGYAETTEVVTICKATITDVKVVRLYDLITQDVVSIMSNPNMFFKDWYSKQYGNYKDNPYVFLYEVEECR